MSPALRILVLPNPQPASAPVIVSFSSFCPACRSPTGRILWKRCPGATTANGFAKPSRPCCRPPVSSTRQDGPVDERWEWVAPLLLDPGLRSFLEAWRDGGIPTVEGDGPLPRPNPDLFGIYVDDLLELRPEELGRRPPGLVDLLTEVALGSPAILALRSLGSSPGLGRLARRRLAVSMADAFRSLFNQPAVISLLRQLSTGKKASRDDTAYWRLDALAELPG